jgi:molecular chaperone DnaK
MFRAKDMGTGKSQNITITSSTNMSKEDIEKAVREAESFAEEDKKRREEIDTRNKRRQMVYQTETDAGRTGDKVSAEEKERGRGEDQRLKEALKGTNIDEIKSRQEELQKKFYEISSKMYEQAAKEQQAAGGP